MNITLILVIGHFCGSVAMAINIIYSRRSTNAATAWLLLLFLFPYFGLLLYLLIGQAKLGTQRARRKAELMAFYHDLRRRFDLDGDGQAVPLEPRWRSLARLAERDVGFNLDSSNRVQLLTDTDAILGAMISDIERAQNSCLLMFYIVAGGGRVAQLLEALADAARRGVHCQLLMDSLGSKDFFRSPWIEYLQEAGVQITESLPLGLFKWLTVRADLRNHRKLLVVDYRVAYAGSYNLIDPREFKQSSGVGQWVDVMMRVEGQTAQMLAVVFHGDWALETDPNLASTIGHIEDYFHGENLQLPTFRGATLQLIPSAPDESSHIAYDTLISAFYNAQQYITITTPYFVPDEGLLKALLNAARRGVRVRLMVPEHNDSTLVAYASQAYYQPLLEAGVELLGFRGGLLHSKTVLIDGSYALFGTVNMDMRSFYLNMELSLAIYDRETVGKIDNLQRSYLSQCRPVSPKRWPRRPWLQRFLERIVRLLSPLL